MAVTVQVGEDGRIVALGEDMEGGIAVALPEEFDEATMYEWRVVGGVCERIPPEGQAPPSTVAALIEGLSTATTLSQIRACAKSLLDETGEMVG